MGKFSQSSIVFEKPGIWSENLKTLTSCNYPTVQHFLLKLRTRFRLTNVYKRVCGFFYFVYTLVFYNFINSSRSKQNKKKYLHPFVDITKLKTCAKCQQKILNSMVVNFSDRTKPGFLEIIEVCLNLGIRFCIT